MNHFECGAFFSCLTNDFLRQGTGKLSQWMNYGGHTKKRRIISISCSFNDDADTGHIRKCIGLFDGDASLDDPEILQGGGCDGFSERFHQKYMPRSHRCTGYMHNSLVVHHPFQRIRADPARRALIMHLKLNADHHTLRRGLLMRMDTQTGNKFQPAHEDQPGAAIHIGGIDHAAKATSRPGRRNRWPESTMMTLPVVLGANIK